MTYIYGLYSAVLCLSFTTISTRFIVNGDVTLLIVFHRRLWGTAPFPDSRWRRSETWRLAMASYVEISVKRRLLWRNFGGSKLGCHGNPLREGRKTKQDFRSVSPNMCPRHLYWFRSVTLFPVSSEALLQSPLAWFAYATAVYAICVFVLPKALSPGRWVCVTSILPPSGWVLIRGNRTLARSKTSKWRKLSPMSNTTNPTAMPTTSLFWSWKGQQSLTSKNQMKGCYSDYQETIITGPLGGGAMLLSSLSRNFESRTSLFWQGTRSSTNNHVKFA